MTIRPLNGVSWFCPHCGAGEPNTRKHWHVDQYGYEYVVWLVMVVETI